MLIGVIVGYLMGRQSVQDKQKIKEGKPIQPIKLFDFTDKEEEEPSDFEQGFANLMEYDGSKQKGVDDE